MPQVDQMLSGTKRFQGPILARSVGQLTTSFDWFVATCTARYRRQACARVISPALTAATTAALRRTVHLLVLGVASCRSPEVL